MAATQAELLSDERQKTTLAIHTDDPRTVVADLMRQTVSKGELTQESVGVMEKLLTMFERMEAKNAERQFAEAFSNLQGDLPQVKAERPVPNNNGTVRYCFAPLEDIEDQVKPFLRTHGFSYSFSMDSCDNVRVTMACTLTHTAGHSRTNKSSARIGKGPPGSTDTQADGAASTYAKRYAFCDALGIVVRHQDNDGRREGDSDGAGNQTSPFISWEKVQHLKETVKEVGANEQLFLGWIMKQFGATKYEDIKETEYPQVMRELERKRGRS